MGRKKRHVRQQRAVINGPWKPPALPRNRSPFSPSTDAAPPEPLSAFCGLPFVLPGLSAHASLKCSGARSHNGCSSALPVPTPSFVVSGSEVLSLCSEACILPSPQQPALSPAVCARLQASSLSSVEPLAPSLLSFLLFLIERITVILGKTDFLYSNININIVIIFLSFKCKGCDKQKKKKKGKKRQEGKTQKAVRSPCLSMPPAPVLHH